jgi:hypothetical protein
VIPIKEIAGMIHPARTPARRYILIFRFFCDESYDSNLKKGQEPKTYNVAGFFGDQKSWERLERRWDSKNKRVKVPRFHAAHLNAGTYEYEGWSQARRLRYSKSILKIIKDQKGKLHGFSCGLYADEYRAIINDAGQIKMGHPFLICFKSLIAMVAEQMDFGGFPLEDKVAVVLDQNKMEVGGVHLDIEATRLFYYMKDNLMFHPASRLATCTPGCSEEFIGLQPADFVAYETFRLIKDNRVAPTKMRHALNTMLGTTDFLGYMIGANNLEKMKDDIESASCNPNEFVIVPRYRQDKK